jgi:hypothetical protein
MTIKTNSFLPFVAFASICNCVYSQSPVGCIGNLTQLTALQEARGNKVATPVTYIMCPNTVYLPTDYELFELNGNANYLCGANGASSNNCTVLSSFLVSRLKKLKLLMRQLLLLDEPLSGIVFLRYDSL